MPLTEQNVCNCQSDNCIVCVRRQRDEALARVKATREFLKRMLGLLLGLLGSKFKASEILQEN